MRDFRSHRGFTRVSVLLGVVMASVLLFMLHAASRGPKAAAPAPELDLSLQEALQDALFRFVKTKLVNPSVPCADPVDAFASHIFLRPYAGSVGQARLNPPVGLSPATWDQLFQGSMAANSFAGAALSRCSLSVLGTGGRFHFCVEVKRDAAAPRENFLHMPWIFAEVSIQLHDQKSGKSLTCSQYLESDRHTAGATVEYLLFAIRERDGHLDVLQKKQQFSVRR